MQWSLSIQHENMEQTKSFLNPSVVIVSLPIDDGVTANMVKKLCKSVSATLMENYRIFMDAVSTGVSVCVCVCVQKQVDQNSPL